MSVDTVSGVEVGDTASTRRRRVGLPFVALACLLSAAVTTAAVLVLLGGRNQPTDGSADAGFARDMQIHHAQAVEMATIIRDRTNDPTIRTIAYDILTGQQQQMGQMFAWLRSWELPQTSTTKPMAWMRLMSHANMADMSGRGMAMSPAADGRMPGMASPQQVARLKSLSGPRAERLFLRLMITHHRAGVMMAQAAVDLAKADQVRELARTIVTSQTVEIEAMTDLLRDRGGAARAE